MRAVTPRPLPMFEFFEHTADVGFRVQGETREIALSEAGRAFSSLIVENLDDVRPVESVRIELAEPAATPDALDYLLFDWLKELLYRFDAEHWLFAEFAVKVRPEGLTATIRGEPLDPGRHLLSHEVKAITYHELKVERVADEWLAEVIVDI